MEKRMWTHPLTSVEQFAANEYVAACGDSGTTFIFKCDAGLKSGGTVVLDANNNWEYEPPIFGGDDRILALGSYHQCGEEHIAESTDDFMQGWYHDNVNLDITDWIRVIIWRGAKGDNVHCTTNLDKNTWETGKS